MTARKWIAYRKSLTSRAQSLRRDPTPAERKLWFEFRDCPTSSPGRGRWDDGDSHYTNQAEAYDTVRTWALELQGLRVIRFTNLDVLENFEPACATVLAALEKPSRA